MKKFTKVLGVLLIIMSIVMSFCMTKKVRAEGEAVVTINFLDNKGNVLDFSDYSKIGTYYILDANGYGIANIPYSYEWSNGSQGSGVSDSNGKINITPADTSASNNVVIKVDNSSGVAPWLGYTDLSDSDYYKVEQDGGRMAEWYMYVFYGYVALGNSTSATLNYYYGYDITKPGVININFKDYATDESISFDQYDAMGDIKIFSDAPNLPYTYEWSDGTTGSGTIDSNGIVSISSRPQGASTSLKITVDDVIYRSRLYVSNVDDKVIDKVNVNGQKHSSDNNYMFFADTEINIDYYTHEYSKSGEINIHFKHLDGTDWVLNKNTSIYEIIRLFRAAQSDNRLLGLTYTIDFGNGYTLTGRNENLYRDLESAPLDKFEGCKDIKITINMDEDVLVRTKLDRYVFGKLEVNGQVVEPDEWYATKDITIGNNGSVDITVYYSVVADSTIGMYSYDGSLTADDLKLKYLPRFNAMEQTNADIEDYMYWTVEGDDTKHYYDSMTQSLDYLYIVSSNLNQPFTIHNIPRQERYAWHNADGSFPCYSDFLLKINRRRKCSNNRRPRCYKRKTR